MSPGVPLLTSAPREIRLRKPKRTSSRRFAFSSCPVMSAERWTRFSRNADSSRRRPTLLRIESPPREKKSGFPCLLSLTKARPDAAPDSAKLSVPHFGLLENRVFGRSTRGKPYRHDENWNPAAVGHPRPGGSAGFCHKEFNPILRHKSNRVFRTPDKIERLFVSTRLLVYPTILERPI